jgi:hypothetical protein
MEWILWFAIKGSEQAVFIAPFEEKRQCEKSAERLKGWIEDAAFSCFEQPKGSYEKWVGSK